MAQQTAMQQAIDYLKSFNLEASAIILEDKFLEKEEEQIRMSFTDGYWNGKFKNLTSKQYYTETYTK